eukprot:8197881-Pyramimonas_sp.AAC.1
MGAPRNPMDVQRCPIDVLRNHTNCLKNPMNSRYGFLKDSKLDVLRNLAISSGIENTLRNPMGC